MLHPQTSTIFVSILDPNTINYATLHIIKHDLTKVEFASSISVLLSCNISDKLYTLNSLSLLLHIFISSNEI
jgi:hypothetical protein